MGQESRGLRQSNENAKSSASVRFPLLRTSTSSSREKPCTGRQRLWTRGEAECTKSRCWLAEVCPLFSPVADPPDDFIHGFEVRYVGLIFRAAAVKIAMIHSRSTLPFVVDCGMVAIFTRRHRSAHRYFRFASASMRARATSSRSLSSSRQHPLLMRKVSSIRLYVSRSHFVVLFICD
jgi:hypothetical protein